MRHAVVARVALSLAALLAAAALVFAWHQADRAPRGVPAEEGGVLTGVDGRASYERHCAGCHDAGELAARLASAPDPAGTVLEWLELLEDHGTATTGEDVAIVSWLHARR